MLVLLIPGAFGLIYLNALCFTRDNFARRHAFLVSALLCGVITVALTEVTSLFNRFALLSIAIGWSLVIVVAAAVYLAVARKRRRILAPPFPHTLDAACRILLGGVALILAGIGITGLVAPPNTWDSMAYHMARVAHWIQGGTVSNYPTENYSQLVLNPWAEFA